MSIDLQTIAKSFILLYIEKSLKKVYTGSMDMNYLYIRRCTDAFIIWMGTVYLRSTHA